MTQKFKKDRKGIVTAMLRTNDEKNATIKTYKNPTKINTNKVIHIISSDKGRGMAIMATNNYHQKMNRLLQYSETYWKIDENTVNREIQQFNHSFKN